MTLLDMTNLIQTAINNKNELFLKVKPPSSEKIKEVRFCPYIYGVDSLEFPFMWGYLPQFDTFYKIPLQQIEDAETIRILYTPFPNAKYLKPQGEEHYCVLKGEWKYRP